MFQSLFVNVLAGIAGLWLAVQFVPNVAFEGAGYILLIAGAVLGVLNAILKPILNLITLPLRILTLGLSSFLINILLVWGTEFLINVYYPNSLDIIGLIALFWTTLVVWGATIVVSILSKGKL